MLQMSRVLKTSKQKVGLIHTKFDEQISPKNSCSVLVNLQWKAQKENMEKNTEFT